MDSSENFFELRSAKSGGIILEQAYEIMDT